MLLRKLNRSGEKQRSLPHRRLEKILDGMGVSYISEKEFPPYAIDVYLPEWMIGIEIDGPFHNDKRDESRDKYIEIHYGVPLLRLKGSYFPKDKTVAVVTAFIEKHSDTAQERKLATR